MRYGLSCARAAANPLSIDTNGGCHSLCLTLQGEREIRWTTGDRESCWHEKAGAVHFLPADGDRHAFTATMSDDFEAVVVLLPPGHIAAAPASDRPALRLDVRRIPPHRDDPLRQSLSLLAPGGRVRDGALDGAHDDVARRVVLRLVQLGGGGAPDWYDDASAFEPRVVSDLVGFVDGHLRDAPSVAEMAARADLSPSHFARKFRQTTGLSLQRFVNRRRVAAALPQLKAESAPVAVIAERLGFSSQSHFTRVFSGATGMTPARFRALFRRSGR